MHVWPHVNTFVKVYFRQWSGSYDLSDKKVLALRITAVARLMGAPVAQMARAGTY
jgi:hypothetical protein